MTHETRKLEVYTCDRCGRIDNPIEGRWAAMSGQLRGPPDDKSFLFPNAAFNDAGVHEADICPSCVVSFWNWWEDSRK